MMKPKKGKAAAEDLLRKWQKRLCLQDWHIELVTGCSPDEMMLENCAGCTDWTESAKAARIEILDPQYYGDRIKPFDLEKTLVHEFLHLKMTFWCQSTERVEDRLMHQVIDDLARALVWRDENE